MLELVIGVSVVVLVVAVIAILSVGCLNVYINHVPYILLCGVSTCMVDTYDFKPNQGIVASDCPCVTNFAWARVVIRGPCMVFTISSEMKLMLEPQINFAP